MNPFFVVPTIRATTECMKTATTYFGRKHYQNGPANAFRHAYWNYLIAKKCAKWSKNETVILKWTKNITDWHENAFKNRALPRLMDLHNNKIGRTVFVTNSSSIIKEVVELLFEMSKQSIKITSKEQLEGNTTNLVHITD